MAIITCPECGKQISEYAPACVGCGIPMEKIKELLTNEESKETQENKDALTHMEVNSSDSIINSSVLFAASEGKQIKCIICSNEFFLSDLCCPKCKYPAFTLSNNTETVKRYWKVAGQEVEEVVKRYRKAAEQGDADVQYNLGMMYFEGRGIEEDDVEAAKWYRKAAEQGNAKAQNELGDMYEYGVGVEQDDAEAVKWYRKAAEQGDADAQYELGDMYSIGLGVEQDDAEAVKWYRKAAEQGNVEAQCNLGEMY